MPTEPLPDRPDLDQLRTQAKEFLREIRAGDDAAIAHLLEHVPDTDVAGAGLQTAQLVLARHHGFESWKRLCDRVELFSSYSRYPHATAPSDDPVAEFLRLACLTYGAGDSPDNWSRAAGVLSAHADLASRSVFVAAAIADVEALRLHLGRAGAATESGGPFDWSPLLYLTASRVVTGDAVAAARLLLDAGADPNDGFIWEQFSPFTAVTFVLGEGELGPENQPPHPAGPALARVLLDAGADANDNQALYNRMFQPGTAHLELLFEYGLGRGDGGVWRQRMPDAVVSPADQLVAQLRWAIMHGYADRVRLLIAHDVDLDRPIDGHTTTDLALVNGQPEIADLITAAGGPRPSLGPVERFAAAALSGDRAAVAAVVREHPTVVDDAITARSGLLVWAAATGRLDAVELLVEAGYDVNSYGRGDSPVDEPWETALHHAAQGNLPMARRLIELGADPNLRDVRFDAPALGWARHGGHDDVAAFLEPLTDSD